MHQLYVASAYGYMQTTGAIFRSFVGHILLLLEMLYYFESAIVSGVVQTIISVLIYRILYAGFVFADEINDKNVSNSACQHEGCSSQRRNTEIDVLRLIQYAHVK